MTFNECIEGIGNRPLAEALTAGYAALVEAKVCRDLRPVYNTIMATGDWELLDPGAHTTKVRLKVSPELMKYVLAHFNPNQCRPLTNSVLFTGTELSDKAHGVQNIVNNLKQAYELAARCEYEMNGHDPSKVTWVKKAQPFMDKYGHGKPVWTPPEKTDYSPGNNYGQVAENDPEYCTVTTDGQSYECPWLKYRNDGKKKLVDSDNSAADPLVEGALGDFGKKLAHGIVAGAMMLGLLSTGASAAQHKAPSIKANTSPAASVSTRTFGKGNARYTLTKADLRNLYASDSYNDRVQEIVREMSRKNPGMDGQRLLDRACAAAIREVIEGKLRP